MPPDVSVNHETDVLVHEPQAEWTVTLWPQYFGVNVGAAARAMAVEKDWLISTLKVYHAPYAKDNFRFERAITGWRDWVVVDLRRKG